MRMSRTPLADPQWYAGYDIGYAQATHRYRALLLADLAMLQSDVALGLVGQTAGEVLAAVQALVESAAQEVAG